MPEIGNSSVFSQTDGSNNSGTMPSWSGSAAPSTLDDAGRAFQGAVTREWNWRNYTLTAAGTADAKTLTYSVAPAAYYNGQRFGFIANTTNTGSATLNVNSLGAKTIKKDVSGTLTNLSASDMVSGMFVEVAYNTANDCFVWVNRIAAVGTSAAYNIGTSGGTVPLLNGTNTWSGTQTISMGAANAALYLNANAGQWKHHYMQTAGSTRWISGSNDAAESGSNAGSDYKILRYSDAGSYLGDALTIRRSDGRTTLESLVVNGTLTVSGGGIGATSLGTITTTSGTSQSLGSLTLTGYKFLRAVLNGVSPTGSTGDLRFAGQIIAPSIVNGDTWYGIIEIDLASGNGTAVIGNGGSVFNARGLPFGVTTATTSVAISLSGSNFDAGSVTVYGIA